MWHYCYIFDARITLKRCFPILMQSLTFLWWLKTSSYFLRMLRAERVSLRLKRKLSVYRYLRVHNSLGIRICRKYEPGLNDMQQNWSNFHTELSWNTILHINCLCPFSSNLSKLKKFARQCFTLKCYLLLLLFFPAVWALQLQTCSRV